MWQLFLRSFRFARNIICVFLWSQMCFSFKILRIHVIRLNSCKASWRKFCFNILNCTIIWRIEPVKRVLSLVNVEFKCHCCKHCLVQSKMHRETKLSYCSESDTHGPLYSDAEITAASSRSLSYGCCVSADVGSRANHTSTRNTLVLMFNW